MHLRGPPLTAASRSSTSYPTRSKQASSVSSSSLHWTIANGDQEERLPRLALAVTHFFRYPGAVFKRKSARLDTAPEVDSLAGKFPDFEKLPRRPVGPVLPGFMIVRSFWRGERRV